MTDLQSFVNTPRMFRERDKKRAAQILKAVRGMNVRAAQELLEACANALTLLEVDFTADPPASGASNTVPEMFHTACDQPQPTAHVTPSDTPPIDHLTC